MLICRGVEPTADSIARELTRCAPDLEPWTLAELGRLSTCRLRTCTELLVRRRALRTEELRCSSALREAGIELDRRMRHEWLACIYGEIQEPQGRRSCEAALAEFERLERELVFARSAIHGLDEDLRDLLRAPRVTRASA